MKISSAAFVCAALLLALGIAKGKLQAEETEETSSLSASASVAMVSDYMFRGFNLYDGTSIQPSTELAWDSGMGTFSAGVWAHFSADEAEQVDKFVEFDYTLAYGLEFEYVSIEAGHVWYTYPHEADEIPNSNEIFGVISIDDEALGSPFALSPTISAYHDYRLVNGQYFELGLSHSIDGECSGLGFELSPFIALGFAANSTPLYAKNGLVQSTMGVSTSLPMGDLFSLGLALSYTKEFDDNTVNEFWLNTSISWESN